MLRNVLMLLVLLNGLALSAQEVKFGKVSKEELEEKAYPTDSTASAAYLYRDIKIDYRFNISEGFKIYTEVHERIKIYDKDGMDYATQQLFLYDSGNSKDEVSGLKGYTYNLVDGEVVETKLRKDGIFDSERSKYWNEKKFTFPDVKEGSVIDYKYMIVSPFTQNIDEIDLQSFIPIKEQHIRIEIPEYYVFKPNFKGFLSVNPINTKGRGTARWTEKNGLVDARGYATGSRQVRNRTIEYTSNITKFNMTDVPALVSEPYVNNINNYLSAVKYELSYIKFPNSPLETFSNSWEAVAERIFKSDAFGGELRKENYYADELDAKLATVSDEVQRLAIVFNHVKEKVKWNTYRGVYADDGVKKAYKEGSGNIAEINLMLVSMLKHAKLRAYPVLVSTRDHGVPMFPTREGFNAVIAAAKIGDNYVLLDATDPFSLPNVLPVRDLNWFGRIITEDGNSTSIDLMPRSTSLDAINMMVSLTDSGSIEGKCREQYTMHSAMMARKRYNSTNQEEYLTSLEERHEGIEISNYSLKNHQEIGKPMIESFDFYKEDEIETIGDKLYFAPLFHLREEENPFKLEKREYPVDFAFPREFKYMVHIKIPEGYEAESVPESTAIALPDNLGVFRYSIKKSANSILLNVNTTINAAVVGPVYYASLKEFYNKIVEKQAERVVLKKI
ncbi:DUF3857 domain-containing protein [Sungkyunkwania multivorans]|uniref:DUF3857 domain-containing protein n=1 Tax=Sungkyunkwania multivorans TaxID=1173618 RepID=A0ABW3D1N8_9FLAO